MTKRKARAKSRQRNATIKKWFLPALFYLVILGIVFLFLNYTKAYQCENINYSARAEVGC